MVQSQPGSSSQVTDGASVILVMSAKRAEELSLQPLARIAAIGFWA